MKSELEYLIEDFDQVDYYRKFSLEEKVDLLIDGMRLLLKRAANEAKDEE